MLLKDWAKALIKHKMSYWVGLQTPLLMFCECPSITLYNWPCAVPGISAGTEAAHHVQLDLMTRSSKKKKVMNITFCSCLVSH